jgi:hypothetical protein
VLEVGVERQVIGGEAHVGVEQQLQPALGRPVHVPGRSAPEQPVVDEHEVGAERTGALEQLNTRRDPRDDRFNLAAAGNLKPVRTVVVEQIGVQDRSEMADDGGQRSQ